MADEVDVHASSPPGIRERCPICNPKPMPRVRAKKQVQEAEWVDKPLPNGLTNRVLAEPPKLTDIYAQQQLEWQRQQQLLALHRDYLSKLKG